MTLILGGGALALLVFAILVAAMFRIVVPTNDVHIVQSVKKTTSYGKDQAAGNVYYRWPSWMPLIGVKTIGLPVSVFDVKLDGYAAYDKGRVPFEIDVMAFFRITDTNMAAQRVHSQAELVTQLKGILQGACRAILASSDIDEILEGRSEFGNKFTTEVDENLKAWGVQTVKCIELMDIRDAEGSDVIENIMAKKKSLIDMQSRVEVANNRRQAETAEVTANREISLAKQQAEQEIGERTALKEKAVGIAKQKAAQDVKAEERVTAEKHMDVVKVTELRQAEITRDVTVVQADQLRQTQVIKAEGQKQSNIINAEGQMEASKLTAIGVEVEGKAKGAAEQAVLMAPVNTQIHLAKEIGENKEYQTYLISVRTIEKDQAIGVKQAEALAKADVKVISNAGNVVSGVNGVMDMFTSKGGSQLGGMLEAFLQTPAGAELAKTFLSKE
jgi:flotillin